MCMRVCKGCMYLKEKGKSECAWDLLPCRDLPQATGPTASSMVRFYRYSSPQLALGSLFFMIRDCLVKAALLEDGQGLKRGRETRCCL